MHVQISNLVHVRTELEDRTPQVERFHRRKIMTIDPMTCRSTGARADDLLRRLLGGMSVFTLVMTIPQVLTIWVTHQAAGVSVLYWGTYLLSAFLWLWHGLRQKDPNIYLPCVGWIMLNGAVFVGAIVYG